MKKRLLLSISYGNYRTSNGGTDKAILSHSKMFIDSGFKYVYLFPLNIFPRHPLPRNPFWGLIEDGTFLGAFHTSGILEYLNKLCVEKGWRIACAHIHHLMNVNISKLSEIVSALDCDVYFYVHDYYNICGSINMLRSDTHKLCHGSLNEKCAGCKFYSRSVKHKKAFLSLLKCVSQNYFFICPSDAAKKHFLLGYPEFSEKTIVIYHQTFNDDFYGNRDCQFPVKIAYIGSPLDIKGWNQFSKVVGLYAQNKSYEFYYFSKKEMPIDKAKHVIVDFNKDINAMTKALREYEIDCVLLWSIWPETYSYTYYEAYSSNCFIISNPNSGNIQYQIKEHNSGVVFENEEDLFAFFENSNYVKECISAYKRNSKKIPLNATENDYVVNMAMENEPSALKEKDYKTRNVVEKMTDKLIEYAFRWRNNK